MSSGGTRQGSGQSSPFAGGYSQSRAEGAPTQTNSIWGAQGQGQAFDPLNPNTPPSQSQAIPPRMQGLMGLMARMNQQNQPSQPSPSLFSHIQQMGGIPGLFAQAQQRRQGQQWGPNGSQIPPWQQPQPMSMQQPQQMIPWQQPQQPQQVQPYYLQHT